MRFLLIPVVVLASSSCRVADPASVPRSSESASSCRVLVAMSDTGTLVAPSAVPLSRATKEFQFGYLLDEMAIPVQALLDDGCSVTFATPSGEPPVRDPQGDSALYFTDGDALIPGAEAKAELRSALTLVDDPSSPINGKGPGSLDQPVAFSQLGEALEQFDAIFIPGGYAPMLNLWNDAELGRILRWFHSEERLTVTLCRGGVALASAVDPDGSWIYEGYAMTTYSTVEDDVASVIGKVLPFYRLPFHPNHKLRDLGAALEFSPFHSFVVEDRELLTGGNQWSAHALATRFVERLAEGRSDR